MIQAACVRIDWTFTGDGLLTLAAGVLAVLAVLYQTRRADEGLRKQIEDVRNREAQEKQEVTRSVAMGLLAEIDLFYQSYVRATIVFHAAHDPKGDSPGVVAPRYNPLPVFGAVSGRLGDLPTVICRLVVSFYADAQIYVDALREYAHQLDLGVAGNEPAQHNANILFQSAPSRSKKLIQPAYAVCGALCYYVGEEFTSQMVAVATDRDVTDDTKKRLDAIKTGIVPLPKVC